MATVVVLGAGVSGHTAALTLKKRLGKRHKVVVVSPNRKYQWIPSNIWVGIGQVVALNIADRILESLSPGRSTGSSSSTSR